MARTVEIRVQARTPRRRGSAKRGRFPLALRSAGQRMRQGQEADLALLEGMPGVQTSDGVVRVGEDLMTRHQRPGDQTATGFPY